jgi:multidrug resistance efflux pump
MLKLFSSRPRWNYRPVRKDCRSLRVRVSAFPAATVILAFFLAGASPGLELRGRALAEAPDGKAEVVKATLSLEIRDVAIAVGDPVAANQPLLILDTSKIERRLQAKEKELLVIQAEKRERDLRGLDRPRTSGNRDFEGAPQSTALYWEQRELDTQRDIRELRSQLDSAHVRAPKDGYVVRFQVGKGEETRKRKPVLEFVGLSDTRISVTIDPAPDEELAIGTEILIIDEAVPDRTFRARVDSLITTSEQTAAYALTPTALPFLNLDTARAVRLRPVDGTPTEPQGPSAILDPPNG